MEKPDFNYKRKPAFISFLLVYLFCFGISFLLIKNSPAISKVISGQIIVRFNIPLPDFLWNLPYGIILSLPFLIYGIRKVLWNLMSIYEFNSSEIRLLTGSLSRKEHFFHISDFFEVSFKQNLIETPFGVGCLILTSMKGGRRLIIKGVYNVKSVVEVLRSGLGASY
jgi:hypothetical protein